MSVSNLIVFDWEGTLSDPLGHVHDAISIAAKKLELGAYDPELGRQYVSLGLDKAIQKVYPKLSLNQSEMMLSHIQQALSQNHGQTYLFPGAKALLDAIVNTNIMLAIASNKGSASLHRAVAATGLSDYFTQIVSADEYPTKPSPDMLQALLQDLNVLPEHALMIGDSVSDVDMSHVLSVPCLGVDFYHQHQKALLNAGAKQVFHDFAALQSYLDL